MSGIKNGAVIVVLLLAFSASWASPHDQQPLPVMVLVTVDGSRLTGMVETASLPLATSHAGMELPVAEIEAIRFNEDRTLAHVCLANGDRLSGRIKAEHVELTTAIGRRSAPWAEVAELSVLPDTPAPEDLTYRPVPLRPIRFEVTLDDGSRVLGTPDQNRATVYCALGRVELPWALVRKVTFHEDRETSTLELWNADSLVGCIDWRGFGLSTGLGRVHVSTVHTREIQLSLGGIDLVKKPYESAAGDRYFLGGLKNSRPKQIQGRMCPAPEFIEAHAGGRIVYAFDQPVREFHAILTMYESYSARKGNVIFKVETEQGPIYSSPPIRNHGQEDVYLRFEPTKRLVLITDPNGSNQEDWSVWLRPEAR